MKPTRKPLSYRTCWTLYLAGAGLVAGCSTPIDQSRQLWSQGHIEESVTKLAEASAKNPEDKSLRTAYEHQRELALAQLTLAAENLRDARRYEDARRLLQSALSLDPDYPRARDALQQLDAMTQSDAKLDQAQARLDAGDLAAAESLAREVVTQNPAYERARRLLQQVRQKQSQADRGPMTLRPAVAAPVSMDLRDTPMRNVFDALSQTAGLNFVFDRDVHTDAKITIFIRNSTFDDVLHLILSTNGLKYKALNQNTALVYPNSPAKEREYQELMVRTFYLVNAEAKQVQGLLKSMAKTKEIYIDEKLNVVTIRDTAEAVHLAERLVDLLDVADSEVMLEVVVMEVGRTRLEQLGLQFPTQVSRGLTTNTATVLTSQLGQTVTSLTNPVLVADLSLQDKDSNLLANPRIRVKNHEKARVLIGEKLPVITTTAVPSVGQSTAVSYVDVGLKLEVEPQIFLNDEVGIKVNLEVNSNLGAVTQNGVTAYDVGTRSATTVLRLHDGETQVLAGLINDNEQVTTSRLPLLGDIPVLGRLFSDPNSSHEKTEIVLLITPRIIRNLATPDYDALLMRVGTEADLGARPLTIAPTPPRSIAVAGAAGAVPAPAPAPSPSAKPAPIVSALTVPDKVAPGVAFGITVEVSGAGTATEGEATLSFDPSLLKGPAALHLVAKSAGVLTGTASLEPVASTGSAEIKVSAGFAQQPDGARRNFDSLGSATTTIGN